MLTKRLILAAAVLALVVPAATACGRQPVRNAVAAVRAVFAHPQPADSGTSCGGCQSAPAPVQYAQPGPVLHQVGAVTSGGGVTHTTTFRGDWNQPAPANCNNGYCPIPSPGLPVR
jgi:hypothetical protein